MDKIVEIVLDGGRRRIHVNQSGIDALTKDVILPPVDKKEYLNKISKSLDEMILGEDN